MNSQGPYYERLVHRSLCVFSVSHVASTHSVSVRAIRGTVVPWGLSESLPAEQVNESTMTHNTMGTRTQTEVTKGFSGDGAAHVQSFGHELLGCSPGT